MKAGPGSHRLIPELGGTAQLWGRCSHGRGAGGDPGTAPAVPNDPGEAGRAVPVPAQRLQGFLQDVVAVAAQVLLTGHVLTDVGGVPERKLVFIGRRAGGVLQAPGGVLGHLKRALSERRKKTGAPTRHTLVLM